MNAFRYNQIKQQMAAGLTVEWQPGEAEEFDRLAAWEQRSNAAKKAVQTKRLNYKTWPTRKGDHK